MFRIVDKEVDVEFPLDHHLHCLICQIPASIERRDHRCRLIDPDESWQRILSIFELAAIGEGNLKRLHFLLLPEAVMPAAQVSEALDFIAARFRPNTVTMFGVEHIYLINYRGWLERYRDDNREALECVLADLDAGDIEQLPVNWVVIAVKEAGGRLRVFLEAKSHPFVGEEDLDADHDLYRGKVFPFFRSSRTPFNFMTAICFDYVYRSLYESNISTIIDKANELFFRTRQRLDLLTVLECNPKPEHHAFRDVLHGFYGEYLAATPGVRDTITVFCNASEESFGAGVTPEQTFGRSAVIIHQNHKLQPRQLAEFATDDFNGLPVGRLRFGTETRLYYFNLPVFHELDPRTTRVPLKVHSIFHPAAESGWERTEGD